jgi:uncharacterized protein YdcH (DUF465 family)
MSSIIINVLKAIVTTFIIYTIIKQDAKLRIHDDAFKKLAAAHNEVLDEIEHLHEVCKPVDTLTELQHTEESLKRYIVEISNNYDWKYVVSELNKQLEKIDASLCIEQKFILVRYVQKYGNRDIHNELHCPTEEPYLVSKPSFLNNIQNK